jgi:hypothetical protein
MEPKQGPCGDAAGLRSSGDQGRGEGGGGGGGGGGCKGNDVMWILALPLVSRVLFPAFWIYPYSRVRAQHVRREWTIKRIHCVCM